MQKEPLAVRSAGLEVYKDLFQEAKAERDTALKALHVEKAKNCTLQERINVLEMTMKE